MLPLWCPQTILLSPITLWKEPGLAFQATHSGDIKLIDHTAMMKKKNEEECKHTWTQA